jgi:hypothetical protein
MAEACEVDIDNDEVVHEDTPTFSRGACRRCRGPIIVRIWPGFTDLGCQYCGRAVRAVRCKSTGGVGRKTKNHTGICDDCWRDRETIYLERKAREAAQGKNPNRIKGGKRARMAAIGLDLPATEVF